MDSELRTIIKKIRDSSLREKVLNLIQDPKISICGKVYGGLSIDVSPASKNRHHSYEGGLIHHIVSSSKIALTLCDITEEIYHGKIERDTVLAAIITHDLMKPLTYSPQKEESFNTTQLGEEIDHLTLIVSELIRREFPLEVIHAVTSHHGKNSPISPRTVEALICFLADFTDAALNGEVLYAAASLVERYIGEKTGRLSAEEAFALLRAKQSKGLSGLKSTFEDIKMRKKIENAHHL